MPNAAELTPSSPFVLPEMMLLLIFFQNLRRRTVELTSITLSKVLLLLRKKMVRVEEDA
jgi:hypothetical protein